MVALLVCGHALQAADTGKLADNDSRFRPLLPVEAEQLPQILPDGFTKSQLTFWQHRLGSDDSPALLVAVSLDGPRVWIDAERNQTWTEIQKLGSDSRDRVQQWAGNAKGQTSASRMVLWPTPERIDIRIKRDPVTQVWMIASVVQLESEIALNDRH